ncbi:hypothetical protein [Vreelandella sp. V005]
MVSYVFALMALATLCTFIAVAIVRGGNYPEEFKEEYRDDA